MNDYGTAILLGVIEGLTEFLPVSSTAHLRISQAVLGLSLEDSYWKMFAIVIQLGAILAVVAYFRDRLLGFVRDFMSASREKKASHPLTLTMIAFFVTAVPAFLLSKIIGENLESLGVIGGSLLVGGLVMAWVDAKFTRPHTLELEQMTLGQAIWIGAVQILSAVFPGTSRSMSTIAAGQVVGLSRSAALEFSFFVSIPIMFAATSYDLLKSILRGGADAVIMDAHRWAVLAVGFVVSFFIAWAVIAWFMGWVRNRGFLPFAIYRVVFGVIVLLAAYR